MVIQLSGAAIVGLHIDNITDWHRLELGLRHILGNYAFVGPITFAHRYPLGEAPFLQWYSQRSTVLGTDVAAHLNECPAPALVHFVQGASVPEAEAMIEFAGF